jgi:Ca2+-binding RTX toxin-like protein
MTSREVPGPTSSRRSTGNDTLSGGTGPDSLSGGENDDTYFYNLGDGQDTIDDSAGADVIVVRSRSARVADITVRRTAATLSFVSARPRTV